MDIYVDIHVDILLMDVVIPTYKLSREYRVVRNR